MSRAVGLPLPAAVSAAGQACRAWPPPFGVQPLPAGRPGRATGQQVGITAAGPLCRFLVIGDHGGVKDPGPQQQVAGALARAVAAPAGAAFIWTVGDIVYFTGDEAEYAPQFYEPYAHLPVPIVGIPGNHDGDVVPPRRPLDAFMANFCAMAPATPGADPQREFGRDTQTQPYCDWTLLLDAVTIIGVYSNVPSGGHLEQSQKDWLAGELAAAPPDRPVIVSLHHPPFSVDAHHGGSARMAQAIDTAAATADRQPELVLSGHVHDYQRFTRTLPAGRQTTYVVIGNSGYHNLHQLAGDAQPGTEVAPGVTFDRGDDRGWGYLDLAVGPGAIHGVYVRAPAAGAGTPATIDSFHIAS